VAVIPIVDAARNVSKRSVASEQSSSSKYDDALGRRAKVMIGKSQDRLHRHGIFSTSGPDRPSLAEALSTLVEYSRFRNRFYGHGHKPLIPCLGGTLALLATKTRQRDNANAATVSSASCSNQLGGDRRVQR
jgi:hypothetical protein